MCGGCGASLLFVYKPLTPGQLLAGGRYTVQRALSKGGMSAIYLASDHDTFDRTVVVKGMLDYFDPRNTEEVQAAKARFLGEARTLSMLRHPAIPQIFSYFADGPYNYIVMEYIEGADLEQRLTREDDTTGRVVPGRPYDLKDILRWGVAICRLLQYLESRRPHPVVHHDIKPANLLLDGGSDEIRLVDFGTARARLLLQPGAGVGLRKSSIFGTQGYAAPEQYGGQSEPRSDVYSLAVSLYHLATDDDPRAHPFDFPRLKELGSFGRILQAALDPDVRKRPSALTLRQQLEQMLVPSSVRAIETPDGATVTNEGELAAWCERSWSDATAWLYDGDKLAEQIERFWGKNKLAGDLRKLTAARRKDRDAGLDAVIAYLDPHGFGLARAALAADTAKIDFGTLAADAQVERELEIRNTGRRYVRAKVELPGWITMSAGEVKLAPSRRETFVLQADMQRVTVGGKLRGVMVVGAEAPPLLRVEIQAEVSRWRSLWRRMLQPAPLPERGGSAAPQPAKQKGAGRPRVIGAPVARVAAATQAEAQRKLKPPPPPRIGTVVIRNRGGAPAWFTKAERQKFARALARLGGDAIIQPLGVHCWNEFRVVCKDRASAVAVMAFLVDVNESKKGVTQLDLEILHG